MKRVIFFSLLAFTGTSANSQNELLRYVPLPSVESSTTPTYERRPTIIYNNFSSNSNAKSIDFENSTLEFFKVKHIIENSTNVVVNETFNEKRRFIVRSNYIIDEKNNYLWDIKSKEHDSQNNGMIFFCTREDKYGMNIFVKNDGTGAVFFFEDEKKNTDTYVFF